MAPFFCGWGSTASRLEPLQYAKVRNLKTIAFTNLTISEIE